MHALMMFRGLIINLSIKSFAHDLVPSSSLPSLEDDEFRTSLLNLCATKNPNTSSPPSLVSSLKDSKDFQLWVW